MVLAAAAHLGEDHRPELPATNGDLDGVATDACQAAFREELQSRGHHRVDGRGLVAVDHAAVALTREAQGRIPTLRDLHLVEVLAADGDALLGGRGHLSSHTIWEAHRTDEARHARAVGFVSPALHETWIEPVLAPGLGKKIERGSILARGGPSAHALLQRT